MSAPSAVISGSFHISWANRDTPTATPRYRVFFTPNKGGYAVPQKEIVGTDALLVFFLSLQSAEFPAKWLKDTAQAWMNEVRAKGDISLPHDLKEDSFRKWLPEAPEKPADKF